MLGVTALTRFSKSRSSLNPASWATAGRCSAVLVEQPSAMSRARAFIKARSVKMERGRMFFFSTSKISIPLRFARCSRPAITAGMVPLPGRASPRASVTQFIELAVNIPAQEPQPGQASFSRAASSSPVIVPAAAAPTASNTVVRVIFSPCFAPPLRLPASIGPPETKTQGRLSRAAAMSIPGTTLSQLGIKISASKPWAIAIHSMESAISSRVGSE